MMLPYMVTYQMAQWCPIKMGIFIKMRAACFAPSFLKKRGLLELGWLQVGSSHFNEKFSH